MPNLRLLTNDLTFADAVDLPAVEAAKEALVGMSIPYCLATFSASELRPMAIKLATREEAVPPEELLLYVGLGETVGEAAEA